MNQITSNGPSAGTELTSTAPVFTPPADILEKGDTVVMLWTFRAPIRRASMSRSTSVS